jgi:hypothetical protein
MADTAEEYRRAQEKEYGSYVATAPIDIYGARAFNVGDPVPVSHVEGGIVPRDRVVGSTTKAAAAAVDAATPKG